MRRTITFSVAAFFFVSATGRASPEDYSATLKAQAELLVQQQAAGQHVATPKSAPRPQETANSGQTFTGQPTGRDPGSNVGLPQFNRQPPQPRQNETTYQAMERIFGKDNTKIAWLRFNGDTVQMIDWLSAQRNIEADRQQGNSYSVRVR